MKNLKENLINLATKELNDIDPATLIHTWNLKTSKLK